MTRGRRLLLALLQTTCAREVAARCRVSPSLVSFWSSGTNRPSEKNRTKLAELYGIPPESWFSHVTNPMTQHR